MNKSIITFKVYLRNSGECQRFIADASAISNYNGLTVKLKKIFPSIRNTFFKITWKNSDQDHTPITCDDDLITACTEMSGSLKVLYVTLTHPHPQMFDAIPEVHEDESAAEADCVECKREIIGFRYKCMDCPDYDLCGACDQKGVHAEHLMLRIANESLLSSLHETILNFEETQISLESMIGATCNVCDDPIESFRYKCMVCLCYTLCSGCELDENHPEHIMLRMANVVPLPLSLAVAVPPPVRPLSPIASSSKSAYDWPQRPGTSLWDYPMSSMCDLPSGSQYLWDYTKTTSKATQTTDRITQTIAKKTSVSTQTMPDNSVATQACSKNSSGTQTQKKSTTISTDIVVSL